MPEYNSNPPTSGPHQPAPALWGIYDSPIDAGRACCTTSSTAASSCSTATTCRRRRASRSATSILDDRDFMLLAPNPELGDKIAYTMWTRMV